MDDPIRRALDNMSWDIQAMLDYEADRTAQLRREAGIIDMSGPDLWPPLCSGHDHDDSER